MVIGGGIGGLTAALALARRGIPVTVHERAPELQEIGAGLGLWPAPLRVFDRLGIGDAVRSLAGPWDVAGLRRFDGKFLVRYSAEQFSARLGEPTIGVHRGELQALLVRSLDAGVVRTSAECIGLDERGDAVTAHFADGSQAHAEVVVGADGRHSAVRRILFGERPLHDCRSVGWRGTALAPPGSDWHSAIGETWGPGGRFGILPISGGLGPGGGARRHGRRAQRPAGLRAPASLASRSRDDDRPCGDRGRATRGPGLGRRALSHGLADTTVGRAAATRAHHPRSVSDARRSAQRLATSSTTT